MMRLPEDARMGGMRPAVKGPPNNLYPDANMRICPLARWCEVDLTYRATCEIAATHEERKGDQEAQPFGAALVTIRSLNRNDARGANARGVGLLQKPGSCLSEQNENTLNL